MSSTSPPDLPRPCLLGEGWPPDSPGGLNRYFADLIVALRDAGVPFRAVVVGPAADPPSEVTVAGNARWPLPRRLRAFTAAAADAARSSDLVDTHFALYGFLPTYFGRARRAPLVAHFHGPWADEGHATGQQRPLVTRAKRRIERRVYRRAAAVVTLSSAFRQVVVERYAVSPWNVQVIPPAVDLERFGGGDQQLARAHFSLPPNLRVVACIRRLVPRMGIDDLLRAWAALPSDGEPARVLLIGGDGPIRADLIRLADELGVSSSVRFLGPLAEDELVALYRAADLCVVPSVALEGFGLVVLEALACGTPVIATDAGGLPEALSALAADAIVPAGRSDLLAARLDSALSGQRPLPEPDACRRYAARYSRAALARSHIDLYDRVVHRRRDPRLRVVYLDHCAQLSGAEIAMLRLLQGLPEVSAHVILAEDGPLVERLHQAGISVEVLPLNDAARDLGRERVRPSALPLGSAAYTAGYVARLAKRLHRLQPDVVHCNSLKACLYGSLAARMARLPVVWHARDRMASDYLPTPAARAVRGAFRLLPSAAIANSQATLSTFEATGPRAKGVVIPDTFQRHRPVSAPPDGPLQIGIVGRLAPWKGQDVVLDAFARAFPTGGERCVVIGAAMFGEDAFAAGLVEQAQRLGITDRVDFRGFQDDVEAEIDRLHVLVHASVVPEPFGQVVVEGMAAGRPVVAAAAGGPAEIITHEKDGLLYPPGDPDALAAALRRLAAAPALREQLATAAVARAADFHPDVIGPAVDRLYRRVLDER